MKSSERRAEWVIAMAASKGLHDPLGLWMILIASAIHRDRANAVRNTLATHWLLGMTCDEELGTDTPQCACCAVQFPAFPSVGEAVEAWIQHVLDEMEKL